MPKIAFLILNYKNAEETVKCVASIRENIDCDWCAVVVDNGSKDGSAEELTARYSDDKRITVLGLPENVGFSKGNNHGYEYIRDNLNPDFVVVTNNDVLFPDKAFAEKLETIYQKTHFYVYGPDIYVRANNHHQSPLRLTIPTVEELEHELAMYEYYKRNPEKWARRRVMQDIKNRICQSNPLAMKLYNKARRLQTIDSTAVHEDICLQGACLAVSKDYLRAEEKMFSPETFLYREELLLYKKCLEKGYKIVYDPQIQIWHEDSSTMRKINTNSVERAKFTLEHHVAALKTVIEVFG